MAERDQAIVEVHASSLNRGELNLLRSRPEGWRPGQDIAGIVTKPASAGAWQIQTFPTGTADALRSMPTILPLTMAAAR